VRLHVGDESYLVPDSLTALEARLSPVLFVRIHRSAIVNVRRVARLDARPNLDGLVRLTTGAALRLSRTYYRRFCESVRQ